MRKNRFIIFLAAGMCALTVGAKPRTQAQITAIASKVLTASRPGLARLAPKVSTPKVLSASETYSVVGWTDGGYAIISNDDLLPEVLAYSASTFSNDTQNDGLRWWLNAINDAAKAQVASGKAFRRVAPSTGGYPTEVPQLLSTEWGQMEPFNDLCPIEYAADGSEVGRSVVGCVATAMSQIMNYHQYPVQGTGTYTDMQTTDAAGNAIPITVNFADYTYDYSKMRDTYTPGNYSDDEAREVAELSYTTGVAFAMIYGASSSGTYSDSAAVSLVNHFGYPNARLLTRRDYDEEPWMNLIFDELSHNRPLMYAGSDDIFTLGGGGHAFVFDGYDADGLVHVNWGWYGRNDGYYEVSLLNPRIHSFTNGQEMIVGCESPEEAAFNGTSRVVTGTINADSLKSYVELSTDGGLRILDLSAATIDGNKLPDGAFAGSKLQSITLPSSITEIGDGAFADCRNLTSVTFPAASEGQQFVVDDDIIYNVDTTEVIEVLPYYHNNRLVMTDYNSLLTFNDKVTRLHAHALDGCFRIHGVELPVGLSYIGNEAFANTSNLKRVYAKGTAPASAENDAFSTLDPGYTQLAIPAGTRDIYMRAGAWKDFFASDNVVEIGTNIKALNASRFYGEPNPVFRYQIIGDYVTGEPVLTCEADENSPVGEYPIVVSIGTVQGDTVALTNGVLRVKPDSTMTTGINKVMARGKAVDVYSVDGKLVISKATSLDGLRPGVYVIDGKKVRVIK